MIARCLEDVGWFQTKFGSSEDFRELLMAFAQTVLKRSILCGEVVMREGDVGDKNATSSQSGGQTWLGHDAGDTKLC